MSIARSCSVPTGHANKTSEEAPYETLTYANGPGFNTHRAALNLSDCAKGLWREIPEEERRQARWDSVITTTIIIIIIIITTPTGGWRIPHSAG
jgi:hypothetical protein